MSEDRDQFKLDRSAFQDMTLKEADNHSGYWRDKSLKERWDAGCYLSMQMYGCDKHTPMDKTFFRPGNMKNDE